MAANAADKLRKLSRRWVGQIGAAGVTDDTATTIPLSSTTNLATDTAVTLVIDRVDSAGTKTPTLEETIVGVVSGNNIVNALRGIEGTAQAHSAGAVVEVLVTADGYNDIIDHLLVGHLQDGRHAGSAITASNVAASAISTGNLNFVPLTLTGSETLTNKTLTAPVISSPTITGTPVLSADSAIPFYGDSMARQAIINGNFDVWQRGTTITDISNGGFIADRWKTGTTADGGTFPTTVNSRQIITSGALPNSFFHYRINVNGAGTSLGVSSEYYISQRIENATRYLCGDGKKITLSFWARSSIANKKIGVYMSQNYGSGGSPTSQETINGTNWTLTSSWVKYTHTFTTNTLASKTFGTAYDDHISLRIGAVWGTTSDALYGADGAETFLGSGNIDIAQVQLCAGDVALPFMPKSYEEELRACMRYCQAYTSSALAQVMALGIAVNTADVQVTLPLKAKMRDVPTLTATASDWKVNDTAAAFDLATMSLVANYTSENALLLVCGTGGTALTQFRPYNLVSDGTGGRVFYLSAEL